MLGPSAILTASIGAAAPPPAAGTAVAMFPIIPLVQA